MSIIRRLSTEQIAEARKSYYEKLRDPRWQRKRLEVLERDGWACQLCDENTKTLNVHHRLYEKGRDPWDYPVETLVTLCEDCHELEIENRYEAEQHLLAVLRKRFFSDDLDGLSIMFRSLRLAVSLSDLLLLMTWLSSCGHVQRLLMEKFDKEGPGEEDDER